MVCRRCPHHVRHGSAGADGKSIVFAERCGLKMKASSDKECINFPFPKVFEYTECSVYRETFKSAGLRNDAQPTSDMHFVDASAPSITDMELL